MIALLIAPLALLLRYSLNVYSPTELMIAALSPSNYVVAITDPYYRGIMLTTLGVAVLCTSAAIVLGFPAAYTLARTDAPWKSWLTLLTFFPLMVGGVVRSAGWLMLLGNAGVVNSVLKWAGLISEPLELIYTSSAVVGGANFKMMTPAVYDQFVSTMNWPLGAALAITLLAVTLCLTFIGGTLLGRRPQRALNDHLSE